MEGTGYDARQTSMEQTKMPKIMLEGPPQFFVDTLCMNYATNTFFYWLVPQYIHLKENKNIKQRTLLGFITIFQNLEIAYNSLRILSVLIP